MKKPIDSNVFICSIVRDAERGLTANIPEIDELCKNFRSARVFVFENGSKDQTKKILTEWSKRAPDRVHISLNETIDYVDSNIIPVGVNPSFSRKRIEKMVWLRNQYLDYIDVLGWNGDYLIVVDLDVAKIESRSILSSFNLDNEWDAVSAFGFSLSPTLRKQYYDTYAYRSKKQSYTDIQTEIDIYGSKKEISKLSNQKDLIEVSSAFGGLTIFRWKAIAGLRYQIEKNNDSRVEVFCEHRSLYRQMYERGYRQFYINPQMRLKYRYISFNLMKKWLIRTFLQFIQMKCL